MELTTTATHRPGAEYLSRIPEAGTAACRLYGPSKTNVADIARLLGKSPPVGHPQPRFKSGHMVDRARQHVCAVISAVRGGDRHSQKSTFVQLC
jgi:hypothetical protein